MLSHPLKIMLRFLTFDPDVQRRSNDWQMREYEAGLRLHEADSPLHSKPSVFTLFERVTLTSSVMKCAQRRMCFQNSFYDGLLHAGAPGSLSLSHRDTISS
jgi:hypothetical protein